MLCCSGERYRAIMALLSNLPHSVLLSVMTSIVDRAGKPLNNKIMQNEALHNIYHWYLMKLAMSVGNAVRIPSANTWHYMTLSVD